MIYLYVKQHSITKLKYFGKTSKKDPYKYKGSGKYWINHVKKHGIDYIETINLWKFDDEIDAEIFALNFSNENNIVESDDWANLKIENAKFGGREKGFKTSILTKELISNSLKNVYESGKRKKPNMKGDNNPSFGKKRTKETKLKMSQSKKYKSWNEIFSVGLENRKEKSKIRGKSLGNNNKGMVVCVDIVGNVCRIDKEIFQSNNQYVGISSNEGKKRIERKTV